MEAVMPSLIIRADSTTQIGTGHIMRCITLAQAWQDQGGEVTFISHCESEAVRQRIINEGFDFISIENHHPHPDDLSQTLMFLKQPSAFTDMRRSASLQPRVAWLVLDGYHFTPDYQKAIRDAGIHLLVIDDMNHLPHYHADILLNQNIHAPDLKYRCDEDTTLLLGTRYILLRKEFLKYQDFQRQIPDRAKNVLVTLGGADPDNVTLKVIQALNLIGDPNIEVKIVVGPANNNLEQLKKELALSPFTSHLLSNVSNMSELMVWADLCICAAGGTTWESCCLGLPTMVVTVADNQVETIRYMHEEDILYFIGEHSRVSVKDIAKTIKLFFCKPDLSKRYSKNSMSLVNGMGTQKCVNNMLSAGHMRKLET